MKIYHVGYTTAPRADWREFMPEPAAPANYKDPVKIAAYIEAARDKQHQDSHELRMACEFQELVVVDHTNYVIYQGAKPSVDLFLAATHVSVIGLSLFRHLWVDFCGTAGAQAGWIVASLSGGFPYLAPQTNRIVFDPVHAYLHSSVFDGELGLVAKRSGAQLKKPVVTAAGKAELSRHLCSKYLIR